MKAAHLGCVAVGLLLVASSGCNSDAVVVVENDGGCTGSTSDAGIPDDAGIEANDGSATTHDAGFNGDGSGTTNDAGVCVPNGITFELSVGTTANVWFGGSTPPWPAASFGCPGWLTLTAEGESSWGSPEGVSINVLKNGCLTSCLGTGPEPPASQSFTWDGTYYPFMKTSDPNSVCDTPACAPPGVYGVTMCVGYTDQDSGVSESAPTCQSYSFTWPPATPSEATVKTTITPTLGGG